MTFYEFILALGFWQWLGVLFLATIATAAVHNFRPVRIIKHIYPGTQANKTDEP